jgi:hypothetical protein
MKSVMVHEEVPKEHATVKHVRRLRKQHRGENLASERYQKLKEQTWGNCGSQKKLAAACRGMTHRAGVAQCKGHIIRKNQTGDKVARGTSKGWTLGRRHVQNQNAKME